MLISSYIESVVISNNIPIFALDNRAVRWANKLEETSLRIIFDWPKNSSIKIMRLMTDMDYTFNTIINAIDIRIHRSEVKDSYIILKMVAEMGGIREIRHSRMRNHIPRLVRPLSRADQAGLIFRDPDTYWTVRTEMNIWELYANGPIWLAIALLIE